MPKMAKHDHQATGRPSGNARAMKNMFLRAVVGTASHDEGPCFYHAAPINDYSGTNTLWHITSPIEPGGAGSLSLPPHIAVKWRHLASSSEDYSLLGAGSLWNFSGILNF